MPADDDVRAAFEAAVSVAEPPRPGGTAAVFELASRYERRRRRLAAAGAAGAACLTVAAVAAAGTGILGGAGGSGGTAGQPPASGTAAAAAAPSSTSVTAPDDILATLRRLLPAGLTAGAPQTQDGFAEVVLSDGRGESLLQLNVQPGFADQGGTGKAKENGGQPLLDRYDCTRRTDPAGTTCVDDRLADGTLVVTTDGPGDEPDAAAEVRRRTVDVLGPDGLRIVVSVWNTTRVKTGQATRAQPALTVADLRAIATNAQWRQAGAAGAAPAGGGK